MVLNTLRCLCLTLCLSLMTAAALAAPFVSPHGYSLAPPPDWRVDRSPADGSDVAVLAGKNSDAAALGLVPALTVKILPAGKGLTVDALQKPITAAYRDEFSGLTVVSQGYSSIGGVRALDTTFTHPKNGILIRDRQLAVLKNNALYLFTSVCPDSFHAGCDPIFARMLASVHWKA